MCPRERARSAPYCTLLVMIDTSLEEIPDNQFRPVLLSHGKRQRSWLHRGQRPGSPPPRRAAGRPSITHSRSVTVERNQRYARQPISVDSKSAHLESRTCGVRCQARRPHRSGSPPPAIRPDVGQPSDDAATAGRGHGLGGARRSSPAGGVPRWGPSGPPSADPGRGPGRRRRPRTPARSR